MSKSGNQIERLARTHANTAISTLVEIAECKGEKGAARVAAAREILDRGYGKPTQAVISVPARRQAAAALSNLSEDALLDELRERGILKLGDAEIVDAEFVEQAKLPAPTTPDVDAKPDANLWD